MPMSPVEARVLASCLESLEGYLRTICLQPRAPMPSMVGALFSGLDVMDEGDAKEAVEWARLVAHQIQEGKRVRDADECIHRLHVVRMKLSEAGAEPVAPLPPHRAPPRQPAPSPRLIKVIMLPVGSDPLVYQIPATLDAQGTAVDGIVGSLQLRGDLLVCFDREAVQKGKTPNLMIRRDGLNPQIVRINPMAAQMFGFDSIRQATGASDIVCGDAFVMRVDGLGLGVSVTKEDIDGFMGAR